ncbi:MAG: TRAP transporter substrate-binding protein [Alphaproteobacteria bacterium]|jgi:TRAP-type mannitol/chloroaromatic compound transport system substrate-binding protein|nr:TRAP transporter substrate-binding protein [Alphaproteobacteria bacterium]MDP6516642.1 TRAP transporter substrate-binding protein [Alphaproteobacteria bacterium]|tara:strand:+ start:54 stop:1163 length:1110 start_codon:yes stop_codon:yes gene_type:complete
MAKTSPIWASPRNRRSFLKGTTVGTVAALSSLPAPAIAQSKFRWKMVTCWPKNFPGLGTGAQRIADRIAAMSDRQLEVKLFAAGELVPAFEVFDAVREGTAECGHDAPYYWIAKNRSAPFFCTVPGGLTPQEQMGWIYHGGGQQLWDELYAPFGLRAWMAGLNGMQFIGWFRNEINSLDDVRGLKIRMAGLHAEVFNRLGATAVNLPGGEIMAALQSGVIDAAEWGGPWMDVAFGFYKVAKYCYGPGVHEPAAAPSLVVNLEAYQSLPKHLQSIVRHAADAEVGYLLGEFTAFNGIGLQSLLNEHDVNVRTLPKDVLRRWFEVSADVVSETAQDGDINRRIYDSWSKFRKEALALAPYAEYGFMAHRSV